MIQNKDHNKKLRNKQSDACGVFIKRLEITNLLVLLLLLLWNRTRRWDWYDSARSASVTVSRIPMELGCSLSAWVVLLLFFFFFFLILWLSKTVVFFYFFSPKHTTQCIGLKHILYEKVSHYINERFTQRCKSHRHVSCFWFIKFKTERIFKKMYRYYPYTCIYVLFFNLVLCMFMH